VLLVGLTVVSATSAFSRRDGDDEFTVGCDGHRGDRGVGRDGCVVEDGWDGWCDRATFE
jgi:hypothetical protein